MGGVTGGAGEEAPTPRNCIKRGGAQKEFGSKLRLKRLRLRLRLRPNKLVSLWRERSGSLVVVARCM